jgi:predicted nicotinamide N-methyase
MPPLAPLELREELLRLPGLPGALRLLRPPSVDALLEQMDAAAPGAETRIPYWAELWPSSLALASWLLAGRAPRRPGPSLELGCGLGLVGLVALRLGWDLELADRDPAACALARLNLARNGCDPRRVHQLDWNEAPPRRYATLLAADILYERAFAEPLARFLVAALAPAGCAFSAEPGRAVAAPCLDRLAADFTLRSAPLRAPHGARGQALRLLTLTPRAPGPAAP